MCDEVSHNHLARNVSELRQALEEARTELELTQRVLQETRAALDLYTAAIPRERRHGY